MATASYKELMAQIEKLSIQAKTARHQELQAVIAQIREVMGQYGIMASDLEIKKSRSKRKVTTAAVKFRDPQSGSTWTGRGRAPAWILGKDRKEYEV